MMFKTGPIGLLAIVCCTLHSWAATADCAELGERFAIERMLAQTGASGGTKKGDILLFRSRRPRSRMSPFFAPFLRQLAAVDCMSRLPQARGLSRLNV